MIRKYLLVILLFPLCTLAQSLKQTLNDISIMAAVRNTHILENKRLEEIEENQVEILIPTAVVSDQSVRLSIRQERLYNSLYKIFDFMDNLQLFLKIMNESDEIYKALEDIYKISKDHPGAASLAGFTEFFVLKQSVTVLGDLFRATQQSKFNLMNNAQRIKLMDRSLNDLIALKKYIYYMKTLVLTSIITEANDERKANGVEKLDFSDILIGVQNDYKTMFPNSLKDE